MQKVTTFLWFDTQARAAAEFYVSLFPDAALLEANDRSVRFRLGTQEFVAFNGGPYYRITPAVSLFIDCADQAEVDRLWEAFLDGGQAQQCGWITDRFGLTWQVVPSVLGRLLGDPDPAKAGRVMEAMLKMVKLDAAVLEKAGSGT